MNTFPQANAVESARMFTDHVMGPAARRVASVLRRADLLATLRLVAEECLQRTRRARLP